MTFNKRAAAKKPWVQAVFDHGDEYGFIYTVGRNPNFFVDDVKRSNIKRVVNVLGFCNHRVATGHQILDSQGIRSTGMLFQARCLPDDHPFLTPYVRQRCCQADPNVPIICLIDYEDILAEYAARNIMTAPQIIDAEKK